MSDELVKRHIGQLRLTGGDLADLCQPLADAIEALTAERDGLLRCVTDNHVALCRAEKAEAERERLREDDLVERLRGIIVQLSAERDRLTAQLESTLKDRKLILEERDRTFALMLARAETAEAEWRKYEAAWMTAEGKLSDADAMIEAQAKDQASNNIRFAEAEHRAKVAEAERDRLREAVNQSRLAFAGYVSVQSAIDLIDRAALKGESHD